MSVESFMGVDRWVGEFWNPAGVRSDSRRYPGVSLAPDPRLLSGNPPAVAEAVADEPWWRSCLAGSGRRVVCNEVAPSRCFVKVFMTAFHRNHEPETSQLNSL
jgi:hypothetical protein